MTDLLRIVGEIEELEKEATEGPWERLSGSCLVRGQDRDVAEFEHIVSSGFSRDAWDKCQANADFIAFLRNHAATLCSAARELETLRAENARLRGLLEPNPSLTAELLDDFEESAISVFEYYFEGASPEAAKLKETLAMVAGDLRRAREGVEAKKAASNT